MSSLGFKQEEVALSLDITAKMLRKYFQSELDLGALEANATVMDSLYKMAISGTNTAATIFWVKTRCGLRERGEDEDTKATRKIVVPPLIVREG